MLHVIRIRPMVVAVSLGVLVPTAGFEALSPVGGSQFPQEAAAESFVYALQDSVRTTVHVYTPGAGSTLLFDDHDTAIRVHDLERATRLAITPGGRLFAYAKPRTPGEDDFFPRGETVLRTERYRTYVYELSVDGTNAVRRIAEVLGTQSPRRFLVSPDGGRIAYFNIEWEREASNRSIEYHWLYVHDTETGELVSKVDAGLRSYDNFRGATWLDDSRIYIWRLPVVEAHLAEDQDLSKSIGPHIIDVRTGAATPLEWEGFLTMLDGEAREREDAAPDCGVTLDAGTLLCTSAATPYQRDAACHSTIRERLLFTFDLTALRPALRYNTGPVCAERWFLSRGADYAAGLETRLSNYRISGRRLLLYPVAAGEEAEVIAETAGREAELHPVGWLRR